MGVESFGGNENTELINNSLSKQREVFDLQGYGLELRNKQERIKLLESRENELEGLENTLEENPNTKDFYIYKGKYYGNNPLRVNPKEPSDIVYLQIESREEIQDRITVLKESLLENNITNITKKLDNLIDKTFHDNPSIRNLLIELRVGISGHEKTGYLSGVESINTIIHLLEKFETEIPSISEVIKILGHGFNILRYIPHYGTKVGIGALKDITSNQLHGFGNKTGRFEGVLENNIVGNDYIPDIIEPATLQIAKIPGATVAGGIDGALDFLQAYVDIKTVPDKVLIGLIDILPFVYENIGELGGIIVEGIEETSDVAYILSYVISVIFLTLKVDMGAGMFTIPKVVGDLLSKSGINLEIVNKITQNIKVHADEINDKITKVIASSKTLSGKVGGVRDFADNTNTAMQRFKGISDELTNSRKALNTLNKTTILADIFGEKIRGQLDNKNNTDIALQVYEKQILKGNSIVLSEIENQIEGANGELKYNLIRIREKFDEMKDVFEREIFPVKNKLDTLKNNNDYMGYIKLNKYYNGKLGEMNELTRLILTKYILK